MSTKISNRFTFSLLALSLILFISAFSNQTSEQRELQNRYDHARSVGSDIFEHIPVLRDLAKQCSSVVEIGLRDMVSSWGILQGLAESPYPNRSYIGIDLHSPPTETFKLAKRLTEASGASFTFIQNNDMNLDLEPTDLLFIDSLHTYCHLTYELEKFSPVVNKYIAMHDTSWPWGNMDDSVYKGDYSEYPVKYDRTKRGLWPAVEDFLQHHPEWTLLERRLNNHGFTILQRNSTDINKI